MTYRIASNKKTPLLAAKRNNGAGTEKRPMMNNPFLIMLSIKT